MRDNPFCGEPQSGLWFGRTDDLWRLGKPAGWGGRVGDPVQPAKSLIRTS